MDKNKSTFKLKGLPQIYWLNLDADTHRREYMEKQFDYWEVQNHTRISGFDGRVDDVCENLVGIAPDNMTTNEIGCCLSHLKAIKHFYENTDDDYCLIFEGQRPQPDTARTRRANMAGTRADIEGNCAETGPVAPHNRGCARAAFA